MFQGFSVPMAQGLNPVPQSVSSYSRVPPSSHPPTTNTTTAPHPPWQSYQEGLVSFKALLPSLGSVTRFFRSHRVIGRLQGSFFLIPPADLSFQLFSRAKVNMTTQDLHNTKNCIPAPRHKKEEIYTNIHTAQMYIFRSSFIALFITSMNLVLLGL